MEYIIMIVLVLLYVLFFWLVASFVPDWVYRKDITEPEIKLNSPQRKRWPSAGWRKK